MMLKIVKTILKIVRWMIPYYIYALIVVVIFHAGSNIPEDNAEAQFKFAMFSLVYMALLMHIMGFVMGVIVQGFNKTENPVHQIIMSFIAYLFNIAIYPSIWEILSRPQIGRVFFQILVLTFFAALMFLVGEMAMHTYQDTH